MIRHLFISLFVGLGCLAGAQQDPPQWNGASTFIGGGLVRASDGNFYRAIHNSTGKDPTLDNHSYWELYYARAPVTLAVAATKARFNSLVRAWQFVACATIASPARVAIQISTTNGNFNESFPTEMSLNHPFGALISISGDNQTKINLTFPTSVNGFTLSDGFSFGGLNYLTITGTQTTGTISTGVFVSGHSHLGQSSFVEVENFDRGLNASLGSTAICVHWFVDTASFGFTCFTGLNVEADNCAANTGFRDYSADSGATLSATNSVANGNSSATGFYAAGGATITTFGAITSTGAVGFDASDRAEIVAMSATAKYAGIGFKASTMAHINATGASTQLCTTDYSPAVNTVSADNALISQ